VLVRLLFAFVIHTGAQSQIASPAQFLDVTAAGSKLALFITARVRRASREL
jgi:hypothetical protein